MYRNLKILICFFQFIYGVSISVWRFLQISATQRYLIAKNYLARLHCKSIFFYLLLLRYKVYFKTLKLSQIYINLFTEFQYDTFRYNKFLRLTTCVVLEFQFVIVLRWSPSYRLTYSYRDFHLFMSL